MRTFTSCLAAAVLVACFATDGRAQTTLNVAYDADPVSLDPQEILSGGTLQLNHMVFDPLVRWTKDWTFEPRLAERWQQIDDTTLRFYLRPDVRFHSGNRMTAQDLAWTFDRIKHSPDFKGLFSPFVALDIVDDLTVDLKTAQPFPLALHTATYVFAMDSAFYSGSDAAGRDKSAISKHGNSFASRHASGTGPFMVSAREQGVRVEFERFEHYWDQETGGNVDRIILTPIKEDPTRVAALLAGDVDFIAPVPPTDLQRVEETAGLELITMPGTRIITFQLNQERVTAFRDPRVRLAINYAINNQAIVDRIMRGFGSVAGQASPAGFLGHDAALLPRYNLEKARSLMAEAGYGDGFSITMMAPNNRYVNDDKIALAVASMLSQINISVDLKTLPKAQYWPRFDARDADMMMIGWHPDTEDSANFHQFLTACPDPAAGNGQYNSGRFCSPEADRLMAFANTETDVSSRKNALQKLEKILYDEAAFVPLHWQHLAWGVRDGTNAQDIVNAFNFPYFGDLVITD